MSTARPAPELRVTLVQTATVWHEPAVNREIVGLALEEDVGTGDLIVLPETFTTGFSNAAVATAEGPDGETSAWMRAMALKHDAAVTGSVQVRVGDAVYNRLLFATPDGVVRHYDKRHLFRMGREHETYAAGHGRLVVEFRGWRICPLVCYDLRFPVFSRNRVDAGGALEYDLLLYVANWPEARHEVWRTLLRARAIENLCYVAAVNRAGTDGNGLAYAGGSAVIDPLGAYIAERDAWAGVTTAAVSMETLREHRQRFPAHLDADRFTLDD